MHEIDRLKVWLGEVRSVRWRDAVHTLRERFAEDRLGRKKFSHPVGKSRDGFYVYMKVSASPESVKDISHSLKLQETILRSMMMKAGKEPVKAA